MSLKCPAPGCRKKPSVAHYKDSPQCIPAVRSVNGMASTSMRDPKNVGRPKKQQPKENAEI